MLRVEAEVVSLPTLVTSEDVVAFVPGERLPRDGVEHLQPEDEDEGGSDDQHPTSSQAAFSGEELRRKHSSGHRLGARKTFVSRFAGIDYSQLFVERPGFAVDGEDVGGAAVATGAVHAADETKLVRVDVKALEVGEGLGADVRVEHARKDDGVGAAGVDGLEETALEADGRCGDARDFDEAGGGEVEARQSGFVGAARRVGGS